MLQSAAESPWTEGKDTKRVLGGDTYVDTEKSLVLLSEYVEDHDDVFGTADHVALFTGWVLIHAPLKALSHGRI